MGKILKRPEDMIQGYFELGRIRSGEFGREQASPIKAIYFLLSSMEAQDMHKAFSVLVRCCSALLDARGEATRKWQQYQDFGFCKKK